MMCQTLVAAQGVKDWKENRSTPNWQNKVLLRDILENMLIWQVGFGFLSKQHVMIHPWPEPKSLLKSGLGKTGSSVTSSNLNVWKPGPSDAETDTGIEALAEAVSDGVPW